MTTNAEAVQTVLIVEDDRLYRSLVRVYIEREWPAAIILEADTYESAIRQLESNRVDLVFLDLTIPGEMHGIPACQIVRTKTDGTLIVLSGDEREETVQQAIKDGRADNYIRKRDLKNDPSYLSHVTTIVRACREREIIEPKKARRAEIARELEEIDELLDKDRERIEREERSRDNGTRT